MALTGLQIFKLLPKTNCGDCGVPTCLAFAMQLAQKKAELSDCPHASDEAKEVLGAASEPPMRTLKAGVGADAFEIGGETEMFRHEKTFYHQTALAVAVDDRDDPSTIASKVKEVDGYVIERVGETLQIDAHWLSNRSADRDKFLEAVETISANSSKPVIFHCSKKETLTEALAKYSGRRPILHPETGEASSFVDLAKESGAALVVSADSLDELASEVEKVVGGGFKDILLNLEASTLGEKLRNATICRRAALRKGFKAFGFPNISVLADGDSHRLLIDAATGVCKYGGIVVLPRFEKELMLSLFTLRQNIYTDPQKPIQVDPQLAAIGDPGPDSPLFVTTNFSLTYFIVSGEIENAGISAWLVLPDCEGMSVLTAWAAGKFSGEKIGKFVKELQLADKLRTREIIIPGHVATISGDLEEALPGWKVIVGPQEAADLASFIKVYRGNTFRD